MIVYTSTKANFIKDVNDYPIEDVILKKFEERLKKTTGQSEIESWRDSLPYMSQVLSDSEIPDDAGVLIEYMIPQSSFRVDFIVTGQGSDSKDNVVIVELKRWSSIEKTEKEGIVKTRFRGGLQDTNHPSYQAWSYASYLSNYNEAIYSQDIALNPCAYLHNYEDDGKIRHEFYKLYLDRAPVFLKTEKQKLRDFIKKYVKKGDSNNIMFRIENGDIKPSKALIDSLNSMLNGNQEFIMIDDQNIVFQNALELAKKSTPSNKNVLIVEGGPGTGKSVVAINLLVELNKLELMARYVTKNSAPREVYKSRLSGAFKKVDIDFLFTGSGSFFNAEKSIYHALIVDEAHRLNAKSGMMSNLGENQVKEIINASNFSIFFLDEDQKVTTKDIGTKEEIIKWANVHKTEIHNLHLSSQFRCKGSNGYIAWLDNTLQIRETANTILEKSEFEFTIVDTPSEMRDAIYNLNEKNNKARMLAGYCWDWKSKKDSGAFDIEFPEFNFRHRWNLASDGMKWIINKDTVSEIGCIHTSQGLELESVGVIIGTDLIVRNGKVITDFKNRSNSLIT